MKKLMIALLVLVLGTLSLGAYAMTGEITVISREDGSGTRGAFIELMGIEVKNDAGEKVDMTTDEALITNSTSVMMTTVAGDAQAIGYVSLGSLGDSVKALEIDGSAASAQNIIAGEYKIARPFNIATVGEISDAAQAFIAFILSSEGQQVVTDNLYIPLEDTQAFAGTQIAGRVVVAGSSSVTPVMEKLKEAYAQFNPNAQIEIQQSDSTTGINSVVDGIADIGMASRALKDSELEKGVAPTTIAIDGIAIIVNLNNDVSALDAETVRGIFTGETTDWADIVR